MAKKLWSKKSIRPHEELAQEILRKLALQVDADAAERLVQQYHVRNLARRIDLYIPGRYLRDAVPPMLYPEIQHREMLVELESAPLKVARLRTMAAAHVNADAQIRDKWMRERHDMSAKGNVFQSPGLLIYARGVRGDTLEHFEPTTVECVFRANIFGLPVYLLDLLRVPQESSYNHLRLMTVPRAKTEEELAQKIQERLLSTRAHSSLKESQVQELMMSYLTKTVQDKFRREDIFQMTMHDAYREGERVGIKKGVEKGVQQGVEQGVQIGTTETLRKNILDLAVLRNLTLSAESKERILACEDIDQLQAWFRVIATAEEGVLEL